MTETGNSATQNGTSRWTIQMKAVHVVAVLIVQLVGLSLGFGVIYGRISESINDLSRRISVIENNRAVTRDEWNELLSQFNRLESEILDRNRLEK